MKRLLLALSLCFTLAAVPLTSGCATVKTNPGQTEVQKTRAIALKVTNALKQTALALRAVQDLEIDLHSQGIVTDTDHRKIQQAFLTTFTVLDTALVQIGQATSQPQLQTTLELVRGNLTALSDALAVSNPNASKTLKNAAAAVELALEIAMALVGA